MTQAGVVGMGEVPLQTRFLGRTGLKITEIGFGTWAIGGGFNIAGRAFGYGATDDQTSLAALQRAFELGVNFVETADAYGAGHSELLVGKAIKLSPRRVHVATKVGHVRRDPEPGHHDFSAAYIKAACDRSLERLGVTIIDLYQLHNPSKAVIEGNEVWDALRELKDKTKISHYAISVSTPEEGLLAMEKGEVETIQVTYNMLDRSAAKELFVEAERRSVGIIARVPLASGLLSGKFKPGHRFAENDHRKDTYPPEKLEAALARVDKLKFLMEHTGRTLAQSAIKFCLAHPAVSVVIPGIKTPTQAEENVLAVSMPNLTEAELHKIEGI
ncbi:MAG TPA: aldo/keto reductase [Planctomycetota bacterium]|jgi:aryl-alcohol dehydrogenase-like predicted oxidoreductase